LFFSFATTIAKTREREREREREGKRKEGERREVTIMRERRVAKQT
jgi:hypothetical protein